MIPQVLSSFLIAQVFGRTECLESIAVLLYILCVSQTILYFYCPIIAFLGEKILTLKFVWITSIFYLISFISSVTVVFQFVVYNMNAGMYVLAVTTASLFASALGIAASRI
ncbi:MAG: hypothetical protein QXL57_07450 [Candidatus Bathyarchaeia archaeon]